MLSKAKLENDAALIKAANEKLTQIQVEGDYVESELVKAERVARTEQFVQSQAGGDSVSPPGTDIISDGAYSDAASATSMPELVDSGEEDGRDGGDGSDILGPSPSVVAVKGDVQPTPASATATAAATACTNTQGQANPGGGSSGGDDGGGENAAVNAENDEDGAAEADFDRNAAQETAAAAASETAKAEDAEGDEAAIYSSSSEDDDDDDDYQPISLDHFVRKLMEMEVNISLKSLVKRAKKANDA